MRSGFAGILLILGLMTATVFASGLHSKLVSMVSLGRNSSVSASEAEELASWNVYKSEKYGFVFKYPTTWREIDGASHEYLVLAMSPEGSRSLPNFGLFVTPVEKKQTPFDKYVKQNSTPVRVGGISGFEFQQVFTEKEILHIINEVQRDDYVYTFEMFYKDPDSENTFRKMLSTFLFQGK